MKAKVYYHHTDAGGVVYYARYLDILEEARTEFFADKRISIQELSRQDTLFVVSRQEIDYKSPAYYGNVLEVDVRVDKISGARIEFEQVIRNQNHQVITEAKTTLVCVDKALKPKLIPENIRNLIT